MNGYIEHCLNKFAGNVGDSERHYFSWATEAGPSEKSQNIQGVLSTFIEPKICADAVAKSNAMAPRDPALEQRASRYADALTKLRPILDEARPYYEDRGYKKDNFAKAKELHGRLLAAFKEHDAAIDSLVAKVDEIQTREDEAALVALEKTQGRKIPYLVQAVLGQAKTIHGLVKRPWEQIKLEEFAQAHAKYAALVKEFVAYRDAHGDEAHAANIQGYLQEHEKYMRLTRDFMHRVEDKKPYARNEITESDPASLGREYNGIIHAYNALR
jgi:hypothetical protein